MRNEEHKAAIEAIEKDGSLTLTHKRVAAGRTTREFAHRLKGEGMTNAQVAEALGIEESSVRTLVGGVYAQKKHRATYSEATTMNWSKDPEINDLFIRNVQNFLNDRLKARGFLFLNEIHEHLGLPWTSAGQLVGWIYDSKENTGIEFWRGGSEGDAIELEFHTQGVIYDKIEGQT